MDFYRVLKNEKHSIADIKQSIRNPNELLNFDLTPKRKPTLINKITIDSGIPMKFHCQSTWNELNDKWGTVTKGKYADIIAVKGDALRHINLLQDVDFVMKGGEVYKQDGMPVER